MSMGKIEIVVTEEARQFSKEVREIMDKLERLTDRLETLVMDASDLLSVANTKAGDQSPIYTYTDTYRCKCAIVMSENKEQPQEADE